MDDDPVGEALVRGPGPAVADAAATQRVRVVVVDGSALTRRRLRSLLEADGSAVVVGEGRTAREAVALVDRLRPAAVVMDLDLPVPAGLDAIERIMAGQPTPILVYSAAVTGPAAANAEAAFAAGAVDVIPKPREPEVADSAGRHADELRQRLRLVSRAMVITHPRGRLGPPARHTEVKPPVAEEQGSAPEARPGPPGGATVKLVAVGASTGGPHALARVISALPASLGVPVLVVQHMAEGFIEGLAEWLDQQVDLPVRVGKPDQPLLPGTVILAASGMNASVDRRLRLRATEPEPGQHHVPSVDVLFGSVAEHVGGAAVGVLLTGMGRDGAAGLKRMRDSGALTIVQDEVTCAVYGMPAAALALGAADRELPLDRIGPTLRAVLPERVVTWPG
jgi:two-component system chemotaxis response regulator CheB